MRFWRVVIVVAVVGLAAFWVYALFFASKEAINKIGDREWAARAESICEAAQSRTRTSSSTSGSSMRRIRRCLPSVPTIVDQATDIVETMLDDVVAVTPSDDKGMAIVPQWEADYRTYLENRRAFTDRLRAGENEPFTETAVDGIPISEKLEQFAGDNEMPSCAPHATWPTDVSPSQPEVSASHRRSRRAYWFAAGRAAARGLHDPA